MIKYNIIALSDSISSYSTNISELSGICFNSDKTKMYGVSDQGIVYKINLNDSPDILYSNQDLDIEGITVNDNDIFIVSERDTSQISGVTPTTLYKLTEDNGVYSLTKLKDFDIKTTDKDGFEGVAYYQSNQFYLGFQKSPQILRYSDTTKQITRRWNLNFTSEIGDLEYVRQTNSVWIIDSKTGFISICNNQFQSIQLLDLGKVVKNGATYFKDLNPESLAVDWDKKELWIGTEEDISGKNLFKIPFSVHETSITSLYFMKYALNQVMCGLKVIWNKITGCFSSGLWIDSSNWINNEIWKE